MVPVLHWSRIAGSDAFHVARVTVTPRNPTALHGHDFAELFWVEEGIGRHRLARGSEPLARGDLIFVKPTDEHGLSAQAHLRFTNVAFPMGTYRWARDRRFCGADPFWPEGAPRVFRLDAGQLNRLGRLADELFAAPRRALFIESFLLNVFCCLQAHGDPGLPEDLPEWLRRACVEILKPEQFRLGATGFSRLAGRSPEHVARVMQRMFRRTPSEYVNEIRMQYASRQLAMSDAKICDIALECGVQNLSHFYQLFRKFSGVSPGRYRAQQHRLTGAGGARLERFS